MAEASGPRFFLDECISPTLAKVLKLLDIDVIHLFEKFPQGVKDVEWLPVIGGEGFVLITSDSAMNRRVAERKAIRRRHVTAFFMYDGFSQLPRLKQISAITGRWDQITEVASSAKRGDLFRIPERGRIKPYT